MNLRPIKSLLLKVALGLHNACTFVALNVLMWRNNLWRKERWMKLGETGDRGQTQIEPETRETKAIPATQESL